MKRILLFLLVLALLPCCLAEENNWYLKAARELVACVGELVGDEAYLNAMSGSQRENECIEALRGADFENILRENWIPVPAEAALSLLALADESFRFTGAGRERMLSDLPASILNLINGRQGMDEITAASLLAFSRSYSMPENFTPCLCVLQMEGASVGVAFAETGEDTITATAMPLFGEWEASTGNLTQFILESILG